jgi:hypothetical protein
MPFFNIGSFDERGCVTRLTSPHGTRRLDATDFGSVWLRAIRGETEWGIIPRFSPLPSVKKFMDDSRTCEPKSHRWRRDAFGNIIRPVPINLQSQPIMTLPQSPDSSQPPRSKNSSQSDSPETDPSRRDPLQDEDVTKQTASSRDSESREGEDEDDTAVRRAASEQDEDEGTSQLSND